MTIESMATEVQVEVTRDGKPAPRATVVFLMGAEHLDTVRTDE